jgi:hypothetical protein
MNANLIERIEMGAERSASALFGAALAYAFYASLRGFVTQPALDAYAVGAGAAAYLLCSRTLGAIGRRAPHFAVPVFDLREFDPFGPAELLLTDKADGELLLTEKFGDELLLTDRVGDELVLTDADRLAPAPGSQDDPLVLEDVLADIGPDARVVRLFDPREMPTPGELKSRIDHHLGQGSAAAASTDASQALSDALAELKRSLR